MKKALLNSFILASLVISFCSAYCQEVTLYSNDFESPNVQPVANCGPDLDATDLNTLWSGTAGGTGGGGSFQQVNTVETILINGPDEQYIDSSGIGGNYCISMLSAFQDDKAALTLNSQNLPFAVIKMDLSAIDVASCGGPFGLDTPMMNIEIYDSPGGVFSFYAPGTLLDEDTIIGTAPGATIYTFNWLTQEAILDISGATDGNITVVFDLMQSSYAAIDNLLILSSLTAIDPIVSQNEITVVPNPAYDQVFLNGLPQASTNILITDFYGRIVKRDVYINELGIDISELPKGNYFLNVLQKEWIVTKKLTVM